MPEFSKRMGADTLFRFRRGRLGRRGFFAADDYYSLNIFDIISAITRRHALVFASHALRAAAIFPA